MATIHLVTLSELREWAEKRRDAALDIGGYDAVAYWDGFVDALVCVERDACESVHDGAAVCP